jgi:putative ATP-dependent endonuclease of OLD family
MRLSRVRVRNFRCIEDLTVDFDAITALIGPNDAGKSSVLRALDWCLNGAAGDLAEDDVSAYASPESRAIEVEVTFTEMTDADRETIGARFLSAEAKTFTLRRTWQSGVDEVLCDVRSFAPFASVRDKKTQTTMKEAYQQLQEEYPDLILAAASSKGKIETALLDWEQANQDALTESAIDASELLGPRGRLSQVFDFVFVNVDLRAAEQSRDSRGSILNRLAGKLDRSEAEEKIAKLHLRHRNEEQRILDELNDRAAALSDDLAAEVDQLIAGRGVHIGASTKPIRPAIDLQLRVQHGKTKAGLDRQGHGFQRTTMLSALLHLALRGQEESDQKSIMLAIEEPEIYQNPIQSRSLAASLKERATAPQSRLSVVYATHSPIFIDAHRPEQVRRLSRSRVNPGDLPSTSVHRYSRADLGGRIDERHRPRRGLDRQILSTLNGNFVEGFFAEAVVLVEGETDKIVIEEVASREGALERFGVTVVNASGKANLIIAQVILGQLGIPTLTVFDNDSGNAERKRQAGDTAGAERDYKNDRALNRSLLEHHQALPVQDFPVGQLSPTLFAWDDNLENVVESTWPAWNRTMEEVRRELEVEKTKRPALYRLTAQQCEGPISPDVKTVLTLARGLTNL